MSTQSPMDAKEKQLLEAIREMVEEWDGFYIRKYELVARLEAIGRELR